MPADRPDLQALVENPRESLQVEVKDWIDVRDNVARAKIARHIAALANHGGGYLIFGFKDQTLEPNPNGPSSLDSFTRDEISSIVKRYLVPTFQCEVHHIESTTTKIVHPVIWVPSHGAVPICTKADGPADENGKHQGIRISTYYIRSTGPESIPIPTPDAWRALIHRCVVHERETLLSAINSLVRAPAEPNPTEALKEWHARGEARFLELAKTHKVFEDILKKRVHLSYAIQISDEHRLQPGKMTGILHFINQDLNNFVQGPGPFYVFSNEPPKLVQDIRDGDPRGEFLECAIWEDMPYLFGRTEFWRVSSDGKATYIRPFWEDRAPRPDLPDGWFSPLFLVRALAELTRHAYLFAQQFPSVHTVEFRCEWIGLQERAIWHPGIRGFFYYDGQIARSDRAITVAEALPTELLVDWPKTVSELGAPVLRLFNPGADFSPEWVAQQNLAV
jgi:hypothetical protein